MCGIAGVLNFDNAPADPQGAVAMFAGGAQPMATPDGGLIITFNGEIFNHPELRDELSGLGRRFATRSDTEVILQAYAEWGEDCVSHMNGQWASPYGTPGSANYFSRATGWAYGPCTTPHTAAVFYSHLK